MCADVSGPLTIDDIDAFERALPHASTDPLLILAVSGGADSIALMHLCSDLVRARGTGRILVLTVDHGLRAQSAEEAEFVRREAEALGLEQRTLRWSGEKPATSLQERARSERYRLLKEAYDSAIGDPKWLLTAHTLDDQAETFLMRLQRGSGVDGLAGIPEEEVFVSGASDILADSSSDPGAADVMHVLRPLLGVPKARLKVMLEQRGKTWIEDPSNDNPMFERVRVRQALPIIEGLGLSAAAIAASARRIAAARDALDDVVVHALQDERLVRIDALGFAEIAREAWTGAVLMLCPAVRLRLLSELVAGAGGAGEPQSLKSLEAIAGELDAAIQAGTPFGATIGRAQLRTGGRGLIVMREEGREKPEPRLMSPGSRMVWDGRFVLTLDQAAPELMLRQLGAEGVRVLKDRGILLPANIPSGALRTLPSLWAEGALLSVFGLIAGVGGPGSAAWVPKPTRLQRSRLRRR